MEGGSKGTVSSVPPVVSSMSPVVVPVMSYVPPATSFLSSVVLISDHYGSKAAVKDQHINKNDLVSTDQKAMLGGGSLSAAFEGGGFTRLGASGSSRPEGDGGA